MGGKNVDAVTSQHHTYIRIRSICEYVCICDDIYDAVMPTSRKPNYLHNMQLHAAAAVVAAPSWRSHT